MKNAIRDYVSSKVITWTNGTGADIKSGDVVRVGTLFAVAIVDIASTKTGSVDTSGRYKFNKATGVTYAVGQPLGYDFTNKRVTSDCSGGICAICTKAALTGDTSVEANINENGRAPTGFTKAITPTAGDATNAYVDVDVGFAVGTQAAPRALIGAIVIHKSDNTLRTVTSIVYNPGAAAPNTIRVGSTGLAATDTVHVSFSRIG
jgi:predicted RecA/RadA family phage recombinase